jgi:hypothetical protein
MDTRQVGEKSEGLKKPNNQGYNNHKVKDSLDLAVHGKECIYYPQKNTYHNDCN